MPGKTLRTIVFCVDIAVVAPAAAHDSWTATLPFDLTPSAERFRDGPRRKPFNLTRNIADPIAITAGPRSPLGMLQVLLIELGASVLLPPGTTARG
jgi:hypothetical protein